MSYGWWRERRGRSEEDETQAYKEMLLGCQMSSLSAGLKGQGEMLSNGTTKQAQLKHIHVYAVMLLLEENKTTIVAIFLAF